jgi:predicted nucleic acid-binding protein
VIAYLDASALVKRDIVERSSRKTIALSGKSEMTATSIVSRAEVVAALAKADRTGVVTQERARNARRLFVGDWPDLVRVPMTEALVERAEGLAWEHGLRGYHSVQLASALTWQESFGAEIVLATFDQPLWDAAKRSSGTRLSPIMDLLADSACTAYNTCMQYTLRGIPAAVDNALRARARAAGKSLNEAAVDALAEASGIAGGRRKRRDLGDIARTWKADKAVAAVLADQDRVDEDLWR